MYAAVLNGLALPASSGSMPRVIVGAIGVAVHDFGLLVFGYSAWAILIGLQLWRQAPPLPAA